LGTEHHSVTLTGDDALRVVPLLPSIYDEPFADSSQIPTYLVSKLARQQVVVSLSGDGGDELFGGYTRYAWGAAIWERSRLVPRPVRAAMGGILGALPDSMLDAMGGVTSA